MPVKFGNAWYVRKDRIQLFIPLVDDLHLEIDRTGLGSLNSTGTVGYASNISFQDSTVSAMKFTGSNHLSCSDALCNLISNAVYAKGGKRTITFWSAPENDTTLAIGSNLGITRNIIFSDSYANGYAFGLDTHTSTMDPGRLTQTSEFYQNHILTTVECVRVTSTGNESALTDGSGSDVLNIPNNKWIMTTYVIDHSRSDNYKMEIHLRWYDDNGNKVHFWRKAENMNHDDITSIQSRASSNGTVWTIGATLNANGNASPSLYFRGLLRNIMLYNCILTDQQQDTMFLGGINPYVASHQSNVKPDVDQYDQQFWGMYGVIATESSAKFEKCIFSKYEDSSTALNATYLQNAAKFGVAARDGSVLTFNRDEIIEGDATNSPVFDKSLENNGFGNEVVQAGAIMAVTAAAWRGGIITGDKQLSREKSRAIWGGLINAEADMLKIDSSINPEILPAGKYITSWELTNTPPNFNINYQSFLPSYFYRDRLGRSWRNRNSASNNESGKTYINEVFWNNTSRYDKIYWTRQNVGTNPSDYDQNKADSTIQADNAEQWSPVYWVIAIYEILREPTLSTSNFANHIKLTLIDSTGSKCAIYHKYRKNPKMSGQTDGIYGSWQFESFNEQIADGANDGKLFNEFISRIYLPHIVIPKLSIPLFHDRINPTLINMESKNDTAEHSLLGGGSLVYSKVWENYWENPSADQAPAVANKMVTLVGGVYTQSDASGVWVVPENGWYDFSACFNQDCGDHNYTVTFAVGSKSQSGQIGDYVGGGSVGGAPSSVVLRVVQFLTKGTSCVISVTGATCLWIVGQRVSAGYAIIPQFVSNVEVIEANGNSAVDSNGNHVAGYDERYASFVKPDTDKPGLEHIEINGIKALYTQKDYKSTPGTSTWTETLGSLVDVTKTPYDE